MSKAFQVCFKKFQGYFKIVLMVFHESFKGVCEQVSSGFIRVLRKLHGSSKVFH